MCLLGTSNDIGVTESSSNNQIDFVFTVGSKTFAYLIRNRSTRGLGDGWCNVISEGFNKKYPYCSFCFDSNYLKQATKKHTHCAFWLAKAHCRAGNRIKATFNVQNQAVPDEVVTVAIKVDGKCSHCQEGKPNRRQLSGLNRA